MCDLKNADYKLQRRKAVQCATRKFRENTKLQIAAEACREEGADYDLRHHTDFDHMSRQQFERWFKFFHNERLWTLLTLLVVSHREEAWLSIVHEKLDEWRKMLHTPVHITAFNHVQMLQWALDAAWALEAAQ